MGIRLQGDWMRQSRVTVGGPQFWGIVGPGQAGCDIAGSLPVEERQRCGIEWGAGEDWCLACENVRGRSGALLCCSDAGVHVAVAGRAWPLDGEGTTDAHLIAELYQSRTTGVINHCDGQFAAAIVDEKKGIVVLTVNWPGGFHRLYYCTDGRSVAFATRLDLLIHRCGWQAKVNEQAMADLFCVGGLVGDRSLLDGINQVIPGSAAVFREGRVAQSPIYEFPPEGNADPEDATYVARLHREAVHRRVSGHDDFGLFLSGGLDSGLNVAVAAQLSSKPVKTFSAAFDTAEFDESSYARLVAAQYGTEHSEVRLSTAGCLDRLPEMIWAMQEPIIDYSYIPTFLVAEAIKQHVDVAVGGDGPDHFLGRNYQYAAWYGLLSRIPFARGTATWLVEANTRQAWIRHGLWRLARRRRLGRQLWQSLACADIPCGSGMLSSFRSDLWGDLPPSDLLRLLSPDLLQRVDLSTSNDTWLAVWNRRRTASRSNSFILADASLSGMCGVFSKVGSMCSAHNLTIHEPYLASPLVRYLWGLRDSWKVQGSWSQRLTRSIPTPQTKHILRRVAADHLPEEIVSQKQKHGFEFPLVKCWQQTTGRAGARQIFGEMLGSTDWFDPRCLDCLVREQACGARNHRYLLLLVAALDQWLRIFIKGKAEPPSWRWSSCF